MMEEYEDDLPYCTKVIAKENFKVIRRRENKRERKRDKERERERERERKREFHYQFRNLQ